MKKIFFLICILSISSMAMHAQNVGIGTNTPSDQLHTTGTVRFENYRGPGTRVMEMDSSGRMIVTGAGPIFSTTPAIGIPDNGCGAGNGLFSGITVGGLPTSVASSKIAVRINITHTYDADLRILLVSPGGNILSLAYSNGGNSDNFTNTVFSDAALVSISFGTAPFTGKYKPAGNIFPQCGITPTITSFSAIGGGTVNPNGIWTLKILDNGIGDVGTLDSWAISFSGPESFTTADQNNYIPKFASGNLTPSNIFQAPDGEIGINTASPNFSLDITGTLHTTAQALISGPLNVNGSTNINSTLKYIGSTPGVGKVLTSDVTGNATWQYPPSYNTGFKVFPSGNTNVISGFTNTILFDGSVSSNGHFDDGSNFNNASHYYVAPADGVYQFNVTVAIGSGNASSAGILQIIPLGSGTLANNLPNTVATLAAGQAFPSNMSISFITKMAAGENIVIRAYHNVGGVVAFGNGANQFSGVRLY